MICGYDAHIIWNISDGIYIAIHIELTSANALGTAVSNTQAADNKALIFMVVSRCMVCC